MIDESKGASKAVGILSPHRRFPPCDQIMKISPVLVLLLLATVSHAQIRIHELMASNTRAYPDITDFEDYPDWIELKNSGAVASFPCFTL